MKKLKDFLINKTNIEAKINLLSSQYDLEECMDQDTTILFTSLEHSSRSEIQILKNRFKLLNIDFTGFILLEE